jgi:hypothetical protein
MISMGLIDGPDTMFQGFLPGSEFDPICFDDLPLVKYAVGGSMGRCDEFRGRDGPDLRVGSGQAGDLDGEVVP